MAFSKKSVKEICTDFLTKVYEKHGNKLELDSKEFLDDLMKDFNKNLPKLDVKAKKEPKDPSKPKRPMNSYMRFAHDHREEVKKEVYSDKSFAKLNGRDKNARIAQRLGELWGEASKSTKDRYQKEYEDAKKEYEDAKKDDTKPDSSSEEVETEGNNPEESEKSESDKADSDKADSEKADSEKEDEPGEEEEPEPEPKPEKNQKKTRRNKK